MSPELSVLLQAAGLATRDRTGLARPISAFSSRRAFHEDAGAKEIENSTELIWPETRLISAVSPQDTQPRQIERIVVAGEMAQDHRTAVVDAECE